MEKTKPILNLVVIVISLYLLSSVGVAGTIRVTCGPKETIGNALTKLKPGETLLVSGTCNENVAIGPGVHSITLDGQGKTTVNGPDKKTPVIASKGRDVTIKKFTVRGGLQGILINSGGTAVVDGNTVENTGGTGVQVAQNGSAQIINNTIRNNSSNGVFVTGHSHAFIGFLTTEDTTARPNTIQNNGAVGIAVQRTSAARINGNTITDNKRAGVSAQWATSVDIGGNTISGNGGDGIFVGGNSTVNLGRDSGNGLFELPNTSGAPNGGFGIRCTVNSSADGRLGALNGSKGTKDFTDSGCIDSLIP